MSPVPTRCSRSCCSTSLVDRGIFLAARGFVAMSLAITDDDCDRFVDALADAVTAIETAT